MILSPSQGKLKTDIYNAWDTGYKNVLGVSPTGSGKCLGKGTPILMYNGSVKKVEDVKPGDYLRGPDTFPRKVLTTCNGEETLYKITPVKGEPYIVNESHILSLKQTGLSKNHVKGDVINISVKDYLAKSNNFKHTYKGWRSNASFKYSNLNHLLPPYLLGLWLGDGTSRAFAITTEDSEIVKYLRDFTQLKELQIRVETQDNNNSSVYYLTSNWNRKKSLNTVLRSYNLLQNKHIPFNYKTGSDQQRIELLAGLIDSDGTKVKSGYDFTLKSKQLSEDIVFVARSLGFSAYIKKCKKTCTNTGVTGDYYRFSLNGGKYEIPLLLKRKKADKRTQKKDPLVTGIKVTKLKKGEYYGFTINRDNLFMLGDFTVTHNTVVFSDILKDHTGASVAIAHRQELVTQISLALARDDVPHRIIGPNNVVKLAVNIHMAECGTSYYNPSAPCAVAGVDTLVRRKDNLANWLNSVTKWVQDEAHHVLLKNKWGKAVDMFPNAIGLGVTATPDRADGYGLGRHADGVFDIMVEGPQMRELIDMGYLTDYRVFAPPSDIDLTNVNITKSGEFSREPLKAAVNKSHVVGDVVKHYLRIAPGKLGITFVDSVDTAKQVAAEFNRAGVPAAVVSAETPDAERVRILREFKARKLLQLVNVDLFGEGFDLPAIEVVSMARPTQSYALYVQQFGRALRLILGNITRATWDTYTDLQRHLLIAQSIKPHAIIIDHVGNIDRHGLPDRPRIWTMDRRERTGKNKPTDDIPTTTCLNPECVSVYEKIYKACPYCGYVNEPAARNGPEWVDGDLLELCAATLAAMRGEIARVDMTVDEARADMLGRWVPKVGLTPGIKRHVARQEMQAALRESIAWWGGYQRAAGRDDSESYKRFYWKFNIDVLSATALDTKEAETLALKINDDLARLAG